MGEIASTSNAAQVRATALAALYRERPISASMVYAGTLTDDFSRSTGRDTVTIRHSKDGMTINGEPLAAYAAGMGQVSSAQAGVVGVRKEVTDVVSFSSAAKAALTREQIALAILGGDTKQSGAAAAKVADIAHAAHDADASADADTTSSLAADEDPSWAAKFAADYAAQSADGRDGRFYKGTDVETLAPIMDDDEYASFKAAFDNKTLTIQPAHVVSGEFDVSFTSNGAGKGMSAGGILQVDAGQLTSRYGLISYDTFFGPTLITWGGPKDTAGTG